jgi:hypothetical protein
LQGKTFIYWALIVALIDRPFDLLLMIEERISELLSCLFRRVQKINIVCQISTLTSFGRNDKEKTGNHMGLPLHLTTQWGRYVVRAVREEAHTTIMASK